MKIATWNINSVRHRIGLVTRFLREKQPDVLCLQETKVINELFPGEALAKLGYTHRSAREALARSVRWFLDNGYVSEQAASRVRLELRPV